MNDGEAWWSKSSVVPERAASIALETEEAQLEVLRQSLYEHEAALEAARARLNELTLAVDRHQGRSGYCKQQLAETDVPLVLALNMNDEAAARGVRFEAADLAARLGISVVPTVAVRGDGIADLQQAIARARASPLSVPYPAALEAELGSLGYLGLAFASRMWQLWALFGIYGLYTAATDGVGKAMAVELVNP